MAVAHAREQFGLSERRACTVIGRVPTGAALSARGVPDDAASASRLRDLAAERRRFGYRRLGILLAREGFEMNHKKLLRIYREEGLKVRRRGGRKRALGTRAPMTVPQGPNQCWALDFVSDALACGRRFRILAVVDDFSRECLALVADTSLSGARVARELDRDHRAARPPACDCQRQRHRADLDGHPALVAGARCRLALHRAGQAAAERLHRKLQRPAAGRIAQRNAVHLPAPCAHGARRWRHDYNTVRPHSKLGGRTPAEIAGSSNKDHQPQGLYF